MEGVSVTIWVAILYYGNPFYIKYLYKEFYANCKKI